MKNEFFLRTEKDNQTIIVNKKTNAHLLQRCQDHWYHKKDVKYLANKKPIIFSIKKLFDRKNHLNISLFTYQKQVVLVLNLMLFTILD